MATRIPINKESSLGFDDRQKRIWEDMETDMERRRREWEEEIEKMRKEFFMLRPEDEGLAGRLGRVTGGAGGSSLPLGIGERLGPRSRLLETSSSSDEGSRGMVVKDDKGNPVFKVLFDVHDYRPEEVSVKMDNNKVMVTARHEAQQGGSSVSKEYSRQVTIPPNIDPLTLQCTMGPDGVLAVEAPIPAPSYTALKDTATTLPIRTASPGSSAPSSSSSTPAPSSTTTPVHQSSSSYQSTSYQHGGGDGAGYPAGYKPVSAQLHNSAPPAPTTAGGTSSSLAGSQQASSSRDTSSSCSSGFSKVSPPYQAGGPGVGRIGSPVVLAEPGKFKVEIDIEDFKPEELTVKTQDQRVVVCAKREEKVGTSTSTRELSRERSLPDSVDPLTIKAFFTDGGKLIIEAPYREAAAAASQSQVTSR
ncbi:uncharacterized protein LOC143300939 [Babylonia areolata]|uniref:uncharacterized protein LOC143300939 n=1 Tax=Babylonia areolata TaxID=304850 RepID=UPI003FD0FE27